MATAIRVSDKLVNEARLMSKINNRSLTGQIELIMFGSRENYYKDLKNYLDR